MDFLSEFTKKVSNVARSVSGGTKESAELSRLNGEAQKARDALEKLYARYGKIRYDMQFGGGDAQEAEQIALRIRAARLELEEVVARRDAAREMKRCPGCGAVHPKEARFCSSCGKRMPEEAPKPEPVEAGEYCPGCGAKREGGEPRCPVCGMDFETHDPEPPVTEESFDIPEGPDVEEPAGDDVGDWE